MRVGIIGGTGWLGGALGRGLIDRGIAEVTLLNRSGPQDYGGRQVAWAKDVPDLVAQSDVIVISVRPGDWAGLKLQAKGRLVISFMAGVGLDTLAQSGGRVVWAMPNGAAEIGASYSPWVSGTGVTDEDHATVSRVLQAFGSEEELPNEAQLEVMSALSGSGPAYPALLAMAMLDFLKSQGVAQAVAERAVEATVCGAAGLLQGNIAGAAGLVQALKDYRGVTWAGLETAEAEGFGRAMQKALTAATEKARAMRREVEASG